MVSKKGNGQKQVSGPKGKRGRPRKVPINPPNENVIKVPIGQGEHSVVNEDNLENNLSISLKTTENANNIETANNKMEKIVLDPNLSDKDYEEKALSGKMPMKSEIKTATDTNMIEKQDNDNSELSNTLTKRRGEYLKKRTSKQLNSSFGIISSETVSSSSVSEISDEISVQSEICSNDSSNKSDQKDPEPELEDFSSESNETHPDVARERLRILALKEMENNQLNNQENIFPFPPPEYENERMRGKHDIPIKKYKIARIYIKRVINDSDSRGSRGEVIKIDHQNGEKIKTFNDFDEGIFKINPHSKKYVCPVEECEKEFPSLSRIKRHYIIHTDIKPFRCKNKGCDRRFSRKDNMLQHYRMHCPFNSHD